jgi:hypothetical protein
VAATALQQQVLPLQSAAPGFDAAGVSSAPVLTAPWQHAAGGHALLGSARCAAAGAGAASTAARAGAPLLQSAATDAAAYHGTGDLGYSSSWSPAAADGTARATATALVDGGVLMYPSMDATAHGADAQGRAAPYAGPNLEPPQSRLGAAASAPLLPSEYAPRAGSGAAAVGVAALAPALTVSPYSMLARVMTGESGLHAVTLRTVHVPRSMLDAFLQLAAPNTHHGERGIETCGVLAGVMVRGVTRLLCLAACVRCGSSASLFPHRLSCLLPVFHFAPCSATTTRWKSRTW